MCDERQWRNPVRARGGPATVTGELPLTRRSRPRARLEGRGAAPIREPGHSGRSWKSPTCGRGDPRKGSRMAPYPFSAVVGLRDLRLALLLAAVSPAVGGVLVRGEKGTAKSTVVRALAALLPQITVVAGCRFACDPAGPDPQCSDGPHEPATASRSRVSAPTEPAQRAEVVRRRLAYEADPEAFAAAWAGEDAALAGQIMAARDLLPAVVLPDAELDRIARICLAYGVDGMRADIVVARASVALAAWHGRTEVTADDVAEAARLALPHRRRRDPLDPPGADQQALDDALQAGSPPPEPDDDGPGSGGAPPPRDDGDGDGPPGPAPQQAPAPVGTPFRARTLTVRGTGAGGPVGRRSAAYARRGRVVGARLPGAGALSTVHIPATLRAAAVRRPFQVGPADLRQAVHIGREANLVLFVVDASGSMAARQRMSTVKTAVLSLLRDAYQRRDRVGLVTFRGSEANLVLPPTSSHEVGVLRLRDLATGGRTPLAAGLRTAARTLDAERRRDPSRRALLVVVTD